MKYLKYITELNDEEWRFRHIKFINNLKDLLLPFSDDGLKTNFEFKRGGKGDLGYLNVQIIGFFKESTSSIIFETDKYKDEIERIIEYLEENGYIFDNFLNLQILGPREYPGDHYYFNDAKYKRFINNNISELWGKKSIYVTLSFKSEKNHS